MKLNVLSNNNNNTVYRNVGPLGPFTGYATILKSSRFLRPCQQLLDEWCCQSGSKFAKRGVCDVPEWVSRDVSAASTSATALNVTRRYKQYHQQMQMVVQSFESVVGLSSATPAKVHGPKLSKNKSGGANINFLEPQQHVWRPQRGLPERSVAILKAWLFEHFLHPYPTDTDKREEKVSITKPGGGYWLHCSVLVIFTCDGASWVIVKALFGSGGIRCWNEQLKARIACCAATSARQIEDPKQFPTTTLARVPNNNLEQLSLQPGFNLDLLQVRSVRNGNMLDEALYSSEMITFPNPLSAPRNPLECQELMMVQYGSTSFPHSSSPKEQQCEPRNLGASWMLNCNKQPQQQQQPLLF
ncbi:hypothetical protein JHK85_033814 [Glycine max]|nr:hypothetical protein JHK85_033814 [Glycine max]